MANDNQSCCTKEYRNEIPGYPLKCFLTVHVSAITENFHSCYPLIAFLTRFSINGTLKWL